MHRLPVALACASLASSVPIVLGSEWAGGVENPPLGPGLSRARSLAAALPSPPLHCQGRGQPLEALGPRHDAQFYKVDPLMAALSRSMGAQVHGRGFRFSKYQHILNQKPN